MAKSLDTDKTYASLYEFAANYLMSRKQQGDTTDFFRTVKDLMDNYKNTRNAAAVGVSGNDYDKIRKWCSHILSSGELHNLEYSELNYVMGYCARLAKMKKNGIPTC